MVFESTSVKQQNNIKKQNNCITLELIRLITKRGVSRPESAAAR